uniref:Uncharacterized protein n=1 Tax=Utricularia reniformis TaxID=192314 RepID=A0A1Y0B109_9LAMI|nr:hypothetical protein AEK19_MT0819 [Utricularia reniformis]YP_009382319.1 hypothetical protein AEK19_MT1891 [Utricularia reniformis]ART31053.1 hypothetical protein AEK19_MT0819 [Utricularia reniformis]ART32059.1 hypothetical protein AEK19_MT1891 [Utricularia reniformis]
MAQPVRPSLPPRVLKQLLTLPIGDSSSVARKSTTSGCVGEVSWLLKARAKLKFLFE